MNLVIPEPRLTQPAPGTWRVTAEIAGEEIYLESSVALSPRVDAFVCALMLPAMLRGWNLDVRAPLSSALSNNLSQARTIARQWWPQLKAGEIRTASARNRARAPGKGLFFTGGVDSSFALYQLKDEVGQLVFVEGFDVDLADARRLQRVRNSLQEVAAATGHSLIIVRTNLRHHRVFQALHWETAHAAALAAVAHTLGEQLGTVYLADSDVPPPYGSHPELDQLWSSDSLAVVSVGAGTSRLQRVQAICQWSPLKGRLRVCWENLAETLNCGRCKKCLLTRLQLLSAGDPSGMDSFPDVPLAEALEQVAESAPGTDYPHFWREVQATLADVRLRSLIETLLPKNPPTSGIRRLKQRLQQLLGRSALQIQRQ